MLVADEAVRVYEVAGGPVPVVVGVPGGAVVVEDDGVADASLLDGPLDAGRVLLELELRPMDADYQQPIVLVLLVPLVEVWLNVLAVVATVGPELEQDYLLAEVLAYRDSISVDEAGWADDLLRP